MQKAGRLPFVGLRFIGSSGKDIVSASSYAIILAQSVLRERSCHVVSFHAAFNFDRTEPGCYGSLHDSRQAFTTGGSCEHFSDRSGRGSPSNAEGQALVNHHGLDGNRGGHRLFLERTDTVTPFPIRG
jgi:hypothetical protein